MKALLTYSNQSLLILGLLLIVVGCEKNSDNEFESSQLSDFPPPIFSIVSPDQINQFREAGMQIYDGFQPPEIYNLFFFPDDVIPPETLKVSFPIRHTCIYDNRTPSNVNTVFANYTDSLSIVFNPPQETYIADLTYVSPLDNGVGIGYATGTNDNFTAFFEVSSGAVEGVSYQALWVISGTVLRGPNREIIGIADKQDCFLMLEKGNDPQFKVADVGTIRVFRDVELNTNGVGSDRMSINRKQHSAHLKSPMSP